MRCSTACSSRNRVSSIPLNARWRSRQSKTTSSPRPMPYRCTTRPRYSAWRPASTGSPPSRPAAHGFTTPGSRSNAMRLYVLKRIGQSVAVLLAAYTLSFLLLSALPGDAVHNRIQNPDAQISPEAAQVLVDFYGIDRPLWEQYLSSLGHAMHGDLGYSISTGQTVTGLIGDALPSTLRLTGLALLFGVFFAGALAVLVNYA